MGQHTTNNTMDSASALAERGKEHVADVRERAVEGIDHATTRLGSGVARLGSTIEAAGKSTGASVQKAGHYLQEKNPAAMREDFMETLRQHPGATLAVGVGLGVLFARAFRGRNS